MPRPLTLPAIFALILLATALSISPGLAKEAPPEAPTVEELYAKTPLYFIRNDGQLDKKVRFYERGAGHSTYFTPGGVYLTLMKTAPGEPLAPHKGAAPPAQSIAETVRLYMPGARKAPRISALDEQAARINHFKGSDRSKWRSNIPTYGAILYEEVYKGIDVKYYGNGRQLEYDVVVKPGADYRKVRFAYEGVKGLKVLDSGDLEVALEQGSFLQKKPYIYQEIDGKRVEVEGAFKMLSKKGEHSYGFEVASYDRTRELVIDPYLVYSTYLTGGSTDRVFDIAVDSTGAAYVTGQASPGFPMKDPIDGTHNGGVDTFLTKITAEGALVYSTFLGGSAADSGYGVAVDPSGAAYVAGFTYSSDFPTTEGAFDRSFSNTDGITDAFITKISPDGAALVYSTYLGGSSDDRALGIAADASGYAYVTGDTFSTDFPVTGGAFDQSHNGGSDAFIAKIAPDGASLSYFTFLGGTDHEHGRGIAVDSTGAAYVVGGVSPFSSFPTTPGAFMETPMSNYDAFVTKLSADGSALVYSTYLGGSAWDFAYGVDIDSSGNAYVTGRTISTNFPLKNPIDSTCGCNVSLNHADAFVTKLSPDGSALVYSTYLGGSNHEDTLHGIAVDSTGAAYVAGGTSSADFPLLDPIDSVYDTQSAFVVKIRPDGTGYEYSTFLGGTGSAVAYGIAVTPSGAAYVAGAAGTGLPLVNPIDSGRYMTGSEAFVARIDINTASALSYPSEAGLEDGLDPNTGTTSTTFTYKAVYTDADNHAPSYMRVCVDGGCVAMSADTSAAAALSDGDYANGEQYAYTVSGLATGSHDYYFEASDGMTSARLPSSSTLAGPTVSDLAITTTTLATGFIGAAFSQTLAGSGGTPAYAWSAPSGGLPPGLSLSASGAISGSPTTTGTYGFTVNLTDSGGLVVSKSFSITVVSLDLVVSSFSGPSSAGLGELITVAYSVTNNGSASARSSFIKFYLSDDAVFDKLVDTEIGSKSVGMLTSGSAVTSTASVRIPTSSATGAKYIIAVADGTNSITESNEGNNTASSPITVTNAGLDLEVTAFSAPANAGLGELLTVSYTVKNNGAGLSPTSSVKFYLSDNAVFDGPSVDTEMGQRIVGGLQGGSTFSESTSVRIPTTAAAGAKYLLALVDPANNITESDEGNNTKASAVTVTNAGIDLEVTALSAPAGAVTGALISITDTIRNNGTGLSAASYVKYYMSSNATYDAADASLGQRMVGALSSGSTSTASTTVRTPSAQPGSWYILAVADATNTNAESNEGNNTASSAITLASGIDLQVSSFAAPGSAETGVVITLSDTVTNNGAGSSVISYLRFYLSTDQSYSAADIQIGQRTVGAIESGSSSSGSTNVRVPVATQAGSWYILAVADSTNTNSETNENNNTTNSAVTMASGIDLEVSSLSAPASAAAGSYVTVSYTVANNGAGLSAASYVRFYLSSDQSYGSGDTYLGQKNIGAVSGGSSESGSASVQIPSTTQAGSWYILAVADATATNPESNEGNNTTNSAITVTP